MKVESIVAQIQGLSSTQEDLCHLLGLLNKHETFIEQNIVEILTALNPRENSLGYLYVLWVWCHGTLNPQGDAEFVSRTVFFLRECTEMQIRLTVGKFVHVCRTFKEHVLTMGMPRRAIIPLREAVQKLPPSKEFLTPVHVDYLQVCLLGKYYSAAGDLLDRDIFEVDPSKTSLTSTDFLLYCYYGGLVCIGLKRYRRAMDLLYLALIAPTMVPSAIAVQAYKVFVLLALVTSGTVPELPKYTSSAVQRVIKGAECEVYMSLVEAFGTHKHDALENCIEKYRLVFEADNVVGLVKLVLASQVKRSILRLTQTYITLSLADIASFVCLSTSHDAEMYILKMIEAGEIHAEIGERDGMVKFLEDPEVYNSPAMADYIDSQIGRCMELARKLQEVHEELVCDPDYLSKVALKEARIDVDELVGKLP